MINNVVDMNQRMARVCSFVCFLSISWMLSGCVPTVFIPPVEKFEINGSSKSGQIDTSIYETELLSDLHLLMSANEGVKVPICESTRDPRKCTKNGVRVFVQGAIIPGIGKREHYVFKDLQLGEDSLKFVKENSTTYIGTPMFTRDNSCHISERNGGLEVEMSNYYANWAGVGNMSMAEAWLIDYIDFDKGIVGLHWALDVSGPLTAGGGSKYVLLNFPNVPDALAQSESKYELWKTN